MSRIRFVKEEDYDSKIKQILAESKKHFGTVPNLQKALALNPEYLELMHKMYDVLFYRESKIKKETKEMIVMLVARLTHCHYHYSWHTMFLRKLGVSNEVINALSQDFRNAPIDDIQKAILSFADKITRSPYDVSDREVDRLRDHGLGDEEILELIVLTAFCNSYTRLALALGIDFET